MKKGYEDVKHTVRIENEASLPEIARTDNLYNVIDRIQRRYGNDLEAFFRDAKKSTLKQNIVVDSESFAQ